MALSMRSSYLARQLVLLMRRESLLGRFDAVESDLGAGQDTAAWCSASAGTVASACCASSKRLRRLSILAFRRIAAMRWSGETPSSASAETTCESAGSNFGGES